MDELEERVRRLREKREEIRRSKEAREASWSTHGKEGVITKEEGSGTSDNTGEIMNSEQDDEDEDDEEQRWDGWGIQ